MHESDLSPEYDILSVSTVAQLRLAEYVYHANAVSPLHSHPTDHLYFVIQGACTETDRFETFLAHPGTLVFHPEGDKHSNRTSSEGSRVFGIEMESCWRERLQIGSPCLQAPSHWQSGAVPGLALRLYREFRAPDTLWPLAIEALMLELLVEVARQPASTSESRLPRWLRQVRERLDSQFAEGVTLDEIAQGANVHPVYLARTFRKHYHSTIGDYVRQQRIRHACRLIATSGYSLGEIALEVGYSDQAHFSRAFKRVIGQTPAEFRTSVRIS